MLINLRNAMMSGKRKPTAKDYVQSGLVAMWDGIENAGWGTHDGSATTWKDLVGSNNALLSGGGSWGASELVCDGQQCGAIANLISAESVGTVECVLSDVATNVQGIILGVCGHQTGNPFVGRNNSIIFVQFSPSSTSGYNNRFNSSSSSFRLSTTYVSGVAQSYLDGIAQTMGANGYSYSNTSFGFGGRCYNNAHSQCVACKIHTVRVYSIALSISEIARNYAIDKARFGLP